MMTVKNILSAGCSFTANDAQRVIGGTPPSEQSLGSNNFKQGGWNPKGWTSWLAREIDADSFVNVATSGCGNYCVSKTIRTILEKYNYAPTDTLVMFNVTSMSRRDVKVKYNNLNDYIPWKEDLLDFTFLKPHSSAWLGALKEADLSVEEIVKRNTRKLYQLFEYLTENAYPFVFTTLEDYSHLPLVQKYKDNLVPLPNTGMFEFADNLCEIGEDKFHPTINAHHQIGQMAYNFIYDRGEL